MLTFIYQYIIATMKKMLFKCFSVLGLSAVVFMSSCTRESNQDWAFAVDNSAAEEETTTIGARVAQLRRTRQILRAFFPIPCGLILVQVASAATGGRVRVR